MRGCRPVRVKLTALEVKPSANVHCVLVIVPVDVLVNVHENPLHDFVNLATTVGSSGGSIGGVPLRNPMYRSLFGPDGRPVTTPLVALATSSSRTCAGVQLGLAPRTSAAAPATCGEAIDVPLIVLVALGPPIQADVMLEPGA